MTSYKKVQITNGKVHWCRLGTIFWRQTLCGLTIMPSEEITTQEEVTCKTCLKIKKGGVI